MAKLLLNTTDNSLHQSTKAAERSIPFVSQNTAIEYTHRSSKSPLFSKELPLPARQNTGESTGVEILAFRDHVCDL